MRLHSFFVGSELREATEMTLADEEILHQWRSVFRFVPGDTIILCDNSGQRFTSSIVELSKNEARVSVGQSENGADDVLLSLTLINALPKKDKFEWIVEKGTELGVICFTPVVSERSEKKNVNIERVRKIAREATEQCGRGKLPVIEEPSALLEVLAHFENNTMPLIAFDGRGTIFDAVAVRTKHAGGKLGVLIGPEGGWSDKECELFLDKKIPLCTLGSRTLRAETASVAVAALLLL